MAAPDDSFDFSEDFDVLRGTDLVLGPWEWVPLDLTGCSAQAVTALGTFAATITVATEGDDMASTIVATIPNTTTAAAARGAYAWQILVTFPGSPATVLPFGHGLITLT